MGPRAGTRGPGAEPGRADRRSEPEREAHGADRHDVEKVLRHIEKDLGPVSLPRLPSGLQPFTVAEYFPTPGVTAFHDPRHHAVSLAYIVPVDGDCQPQQNALDLAWLSPVEVLDPVVQAEMVPGHAAIVRAAMTHCGLA